ncbi:MAG: hypothetical protein AB8G05_07235 [Oligoflexales bacterium]
MEAKLSLKRKELDSFVLQQGLWNRIQLVRELLGNNTVLIYEDGVA